MTDRSFLNNSISTLVEGKAFIEALNEAGLMFHFEDNPNEIGYMENGEIVNTFNKEEVIEVSARINELYALDWLEYECPIGYVLELDNED